MHLIMWGFGHKINQLLPKKQYSNDKKRSWKMSAEQALIKAALTSGRGPVIATVTNALLKGIRSRVDDMFEAVYKNKRW